MYKECSGSTATVYNIHPLCCSLVEYCHETFQLHFMSHSDNNIIMRSPTFVDSYCTESSAAVCHGFSRSVMEMFTYKSIIK